ncbi:MULTISPECIES: SsgA family sporulation/cell division regulator [Kitasatospora]|uniref:Putative sporulation and cell division protein n=1 Tax=Kitasatospora setae (strain ATCC 33774 / DSM 43861 / JCM 3304 / KCC A-0304 / NBRC 14216 / KM-6054) TaxID=452652 RepID=E4N777_KITSK|nr:MULTISPECIES: SsgA family sporulation/cell division regulator [Kitasatospora]BAJ27058.1 putative sporulation and cell division protein [Kitasatospora setae KM-6054]
MRNTVRTRTAMHLLVPGGPALRTPADLDYDTADPLAVRLTFHPPGDGPVEWVVARTLLLAGLSGPAGEGDLRISPLVDAGLAEVALTLRSPEGEATLRSPAPPLLAFLARTGRLVPLGREQVTADLDRKLAGILAAG